jgi:hypothetical protein
MTTQFYDAVGLPAPAADPAEVPVDAGDLPRLRGRLLAAGARVQEETSTSLSFRDPDGVRVVLAAR